MHKACLTVVSHTYNSFILNQFNDDCFTSIQIPTEIAFFKIEFLAHPPTDLEVMEPLPLNSF